MRLIQFLLWALFFYLGYKVVKRAIQPKQGGTTVRGRAKKKSLDIDESQIEDAEFEDIDNKE